MSDHASETDGLEVKEDVWAEILEESKRRHPAFLGRLDTDDFFPVSYLFITDLRPGDIIDIREFGFDAVPDMAFLEISPNGIVSDRQGVYSITGKLADETEFIIGREDGLPMKRRRAVRYARRVHI